MLKKVPSMKAIEYDNIIKNKDELIQQLEALKRDAIDNFRATPNDLKVVFQKDMHALRIVINFVKELK